MRNRFDQLGKGILRGALSSAGAVTPQREVVADAQAIDAWFQPDPARAGALARAGLLGRMALGEPCLFEPFHKAPAIDDIRSCVRKQLTVDRLRVREARRARRPRPPFPRLWVLAAGRPESVLRGYGFRRMRGWPRGFLQRHEADAVGLVVLRDLPRVRETLLLRLTGAGSALRRALADLTDLPPDAWERQVAVPVLMALRFELPEDGSEQEREYLMSTQTLYDQWVAHFTSEGIKQGIKHGIEQGLQAALITLYEARFGRVPPEIVAAIHATHDRATLQRWLAKAATCSAKELTAVLRLTSLLLDQPPPPLS